MTSFKPAWTLSMCHSGFQAMVNAWLSACNEVIVKWLLQVLHTQSHKFHSWIEMKNLMGEKRLLKASQMSRNIKPKWNFIYHLQNCTVWQIKFYNFQCLKFPVSKTESPKKESCNSTPVTLMNFVYSVY